VSSTVRLTGFTPTKPVAKVVELAGKLTDVNTAAKPRKVVPVEREWRPEFKGGAAGYTFPPHSFTVLELDLAGQ